MKARSGQHETAKRLVERLIEAEIDYLLARAEGRRSRAADERYRVRVGVDLEQKRQRADIRDREVRTDAEIVRREKEIEAAAGGRAWNRIALYLWLCPVLLKIAAVVVSAIRG